MFTREPSGWSVSGRGLGFRFERQIRPGVVCVAERHNPLCGTESHSLNPTPYVDMNIEITPKKTDGVERLLQISVPVETVRDAEEKAARRYATRVRLPGFRPGKAPTAMIKKKFAEAIRAETLESLVQEAYKQVIESEKFKLASQPHVHDVKFGDNEVRMMTDAREQGEAMLRAAGLTNVVSWQNEHVPGDAIHEMGGARMGNDPRQSVLNKWSQAHDAANLFVTDGAQMASISCVNPSLTFMAFTARATDHAVKQLRAGAI